MLRSVIPLFIVMLAVCSADAGCMSCISKTGSSYTEQVCDGDSTFDVIRKCGPPDYKEEVAEETTGEITSGPTWRPHTGTLKVQKRKVEKFYYDCGYSRFVRVLTFSGGRLLSIDEGGRGAGEQKCW